MRFVIGRFVRDTVPVVNIVGGSPVIVPNWIIVVTSRDRLEIRRESIISSKTIAGTVSPYLQGIVVDIA